jgi:cytoskeletal protein CcmA (bactofilin family)
VSRARARGRASHWFVAGAFGLQVVLGSYCGERPAELGESHWGTSCSRVTHRPRQNRCLRRVLTAPTVRRRSISTPSTGEKSVIGNDLKIIGQGLRIIIRGILQVDGEIEGDVLAAEIIVGEKGKVTGMVAGQQVVIRGTVSGVVCGKAVALQASSPVDGDVHHMSFAIEQGPSSRVAAVVRGANQICSGSTSVAGLAC